MNKRIVLYLPIFMLLGGLLSVHFGKDLSWDMANYHFYNPFAFFNNRDQYDFWPSSFVHQYINPTIDFISYFLITRISPWSAEFILGAIHSINAWLLFLIAKEFIRETGREWIPVFLAIFGICGPTVLPGIGSFMNDNLISLFVLCFVLLQIKSLDALGSEQIKLFNRLQISSGVLLGISFGLKLTAGVYIAAALLTTLIVPVSFSHRLRMLFYWGVAALSAFILIAGYWMAIQWMKYHNPVFPFFNGFFHSNEFIQINWRDERFLPSGILQHLFYPFYFSFEGKMIADADYSDFRILITFSLFLVAGWQWLWRYFKGETLLVSNKKRFWLYAFVIFSYWIWQEYFSIARYFASIEMLAPLLIFLLIDQLFCNQRMRLAFTLLVIYFIVITIDPIAMVRKRIDNFSYFNVTLPVLNKSRAHVLISYSAYVYDADPRPQAYLIPFFPREWQFTGIPFWHGKYLEDEITSGKIKARISQLDEPIYLLTSNYNMPEFYRIAARFHLRASGSCEVIKSDRQMMTNQETWLCPVKKI